MIKTVPVILLIGTVPVTYAAPPNPEIYDVEAGFRKGLGAKALTSKLPVPKLPSYKVPQYANIISTGTKKIAVLAIEFQDIKYNPLHNPVYINNMVFSTSTTNSLNAFYYENSFHKLNFVNTSTANPSGWWTSAQNMSYYGTDADGIDSYSGDIRKLVKEAVNKAVTGGFKFAEYDEDIDGFIDHLIVVHAGPAQENSSASNAIWSHRWEFDESPLSPMYYPSVDGGKKIKSYLIVGEDSPLGIFAHEFGHDLGLPDLYSTEGSKPTTVGGWCLMDYGAWSGSPAGSNPSHLSPWCKNYLGWSNVKTQNGAEQDIRLYNTETVFPSGEYNCIKINLLGDAKEYILLEYRKKDAQNAFFDKTMPASGVVAWHIDETIMYQEIIWETEKNTRFYHNMINTGDIKAIDVIEYEGAGQTSQSPWKSGDMFTEGKVLTGSKTDKYSGQSTGISAIMGGSFSDYVPVSIVMLSMGESFSIAKSFTYPNPVRQAGAKPKFSFEFSRPVSDGQVYIYTISGEEVAKVGITNFDISKSTDNGWAYEAEWDLKNTEGRNVSAGIYVYRFIGSGVAKTGKFAILK